MRFAGEYALDPGPCPADYLDRVTSVRKGSVYTTTRNYSPTDGTLTALNTTAAGSTIQNLSFGYDGLGNLTSRSGSGGTEPLTYDNLNRLKTSKQGTMTYDVNGNILNKPDVNGTTSISNYTYDPNHPHAVTTAFGYSMTYDLNGNLLSRTNGTESWSLAWTGFDKPLWMIKANGSTVAGSEFHYNAARSRVMQLEIDAATGAAPNQAPSHYIRKRLYGLGSTLEVNYSNTAGVGATPSWTLSPVGGVRIYVPGPEGIIGVREFNSTQPAGQQEKDLIYHYDHLGSIESITTAFASPPYTFTANANQSGYPGLFSEDAWGQRRNPFTWSGAPVTVGANASDVGGATSLTPRGFTGHEMLDGLGLVHMNGRIYDPLLGRFLSADIVVQAPGNLQAYNRYSYVVNNPLSLVDPTGFLNETAFGQQLFEDGTVGESFLSELETRSSAGWTYKSFSDYRGDTGNINGKVGGVTDDDHTTVYVQDKGSSMTTIVDHTVHETGHTYQPKSTTVGGYKDNERGAFRKEAQYGIDAKRPGDLTKRERDPKTGKKEYRVDEAAIDARLDDAYNLKGVDPNTKIAGSNLSDARFSRVEIVNVKMVRLSYEASAAEAAAKQANKTARQVEKEAKRADPAHKTEADAKAKEARAAADDAAARAKAARDQADEERKSLKKERGY